MLYFYLFIIVQVVLESFPVSSSGHLVLLEQCMRKIGYTNGLGWGIPLTVLEHFLHGVTLIVLVCCLGSRWWRRYVQCADKPSCIVQISIFMCIADVMTIIIYLLFTTETVSAVIACIPLGGGFLVTALALLSLRWVPSHVDAGMTMHKAVLLGIVQGITLIPGISRLGVTYSAACWLGLSSECAFDFSFLMHVPLIAGAFLNSMHILYARQALRYVVQWPVGSVMLFSGVLAGGGLYVMVTLVKLRKVWLFSFYMIVPLVLWAILFVF